MDKKEIVIATGNQNKLREFRRMLEPYGFKVDSLKEEGVEIDIEETGKTFEENSYLKASCIAQKLPDKIVIADDSGLQVHALDNFPGIYSARFMEGHPYEEKCKEIIKRLEGKTDRSANFVCAITLVNYGPAPLYFVGKAYGKIADKICGHDGFGYDPIFISDDLGKTFAEATPEEKDSVSHRGKAFRLLEAFLKAHETVK
jgi:XTP/dITP diphosphohydrolase